MSTEVVDDDMWQPIHAAACWGHLEVVEMLAQNGANISAKTKNGETPFDICEDPEIKVSFTSFRNSGWSIPIPMVFPIHDPPQQMGDGNRYCIVIEKELFHDMMTKP